MSCFCMIFSPYESSCQFPFGDSNFFLIIKKRRNWLFCLKSHEVVRILTIGCLKPLELRNDSLVEEK